MRLRDELSNATLLKLSDHYKAYIFTIGWSEQGMEAMLSQLDSELVESLLAYAFGSCNPAERNYNSFDEECLAVVWVTTHFRKYLFGNSCTMVTDHELL